MEPCDACRALVGKPSTVAPHGDLAAAGFCTSGSPGHMTRVSNNWNCTVCGSWLYQNTADNVVPNKWTMGKRPLDWPEDK
jgi:hypothetical protein